MDYIINRYKWDHKYLTNIKVFSPVMVQKRLINTDLAEWLCPSMAWAFSLMNCGCWANHDLLFRELKECGKKNCLFPHPLPHHCPVICVSFVNKPNHCIWFLGQRWPVVSSVRLDAENADKDDDESFGWTGHSREGSCESRSKSKWELWLFYHLLASSILAAFLFAIQS